MAQGFLYARPQPAAIFEAWMDGWGMPPGVVS